MAESNGCAKAFRRVTRGALESTCSPGCELSNMRDWVATLGGYFTRARRFNTENTFVHREETTKKTERVKKNGDSQFDCPSKKSRLQRRGQAKVCPTFWRRLWRRLRRISW